MTLHLKRINGFGNGNGGGGGGGGDVEVLETMQDFCSQKGKSSDYSYLSKCNSFCFIDDKFFIFYTSTNPGGGSNTVYIGKAKSISVDFANEENVQTISFSFGQSYLTPLDFGNVVAVSPDKTKVVLLWGAGQYKISVMPLTIVNGNYNFGTFVNSDTPDLSNPSIVRFVSNDTFVVANGSSLYAYQIQSDNTITLLTTFTNSETISMVLTYGEIVCIINTSSKKVLFLDNIIDKNIIYSETSSDNFTTNTQNSKSFFVVDNRFYLATVSYITRPFKVFEINNGIVSSLSFTTTFTTGNYPNNAIYPLVLKNDNNIVVIALPLAEASGLKTLYLLKIDFNNLTMENGVVVNNYLVTASASYGTVWLDREQNLLYFMTTYQASHYNYTFKFNPSVIDYKIKYNGWIYVVEDEASE